jgi:hypothetical protein
MKGVVFVELVAMAENAFGENAVDTAISRCPLTSKGAYTTVGTYDHAELGQLVGAFSEHSGLSVDDLRRTFGHWILGRFAETYPSFFESQPDAFSMLESVEGEVHAEVRKLYPDADLPTFETERPDQASLRLVYRSPRRLGTFCHGMIEACLGYYGETADIIALDQSTPEMGVVEFLIRHTAA